MCHFQKCGEKGNTFYKKYVNNMENVREKLKCLYSQKGFDFEWLVGPN